MEVLEKFKIFKALVEKKIGFNILKLHSNNGGEYIYSRLLSTFVKNMTLNNKSLYFIYLNKMEL